MTGLNFPPDLSGVAVAGIQTQTLLDHMWACSKLRPELDHIIATQLQGRHPAKSCCLAVGAQHPKSHEARAVIVASNRKETKSSYQPGKLRKPCAEICVQQGLTLWLSAVLQVPYRMTY